VIKVKSAELSFISSQLPDTPPSLRSYPWSVLVVRDASGVPSKKADPALSPTASIIVLSENVNATPPSSVIPVPYVTSGATLSL